MNKMIAGEKANRRILWLAGLALLLGNLPRAVAQAPEERGLAIARQADRRYSGYHDFTAHLTMVLRNRDGKERTREMWIRGVEVDGDGDKTMVIFDRPRELQGTALLTFGHTEESDDQWLYLPALKRVKRIASNNQSGSFMGSEFAYEDIGSQEVERYTYRYVGNDTLSGVEAFVVERYPVDRHSGYSRQVVWLDKEEYRALRIDYYNRGDELLKTLSFSGYRQYADKYWRPGAMVMVNHQTGRATILTWSRYEFGTGLSDRDFNPTSLRRAR